jgi:hypothetical protein
MKCNLFCLGCLFLAAVFAIFAYAPGGLGLDVRSSTGTWADNVFWALIVVGAIPAAIQLLFDEYRAFRCWLRQFGCHREDRLSSE